MYGSFLKSRHIFYPMNYCIAQKLVVEVFGKLMSKCFVEKMVGWLISDI